MRLRRSVCDAPGISRRRRGKGFSYVAPDGKPVRDEEVLTRIRSLVQPPAWTDVWICPRPNGHIQAMGKDAAGWRQYRYHDAWRERRDQEKFDRVLELGRKLPSLRQRVAKDLRRKGMPRDRSLAAAVRLLDIASFRVGSEEYAKEHETYGLSTLRPEHVRTNGTKVSFDFPGKNGTRQARVVEDPQVAAVMRELRRRRGKETLLAWRDGGRWVNVNADDINAYIKQIAGEDLRPRTSAPGTLPC